MKQILKTGFGMTVLLFLISVGLFLILSGTRQSNQAGTQLVMINEIKQLLQEESDTAPVSEPFFQLEKSIKQETYGAKQREVLKICTVFFCFGLFTVWSVIWILYREIVKPFETLQDYAQEVAAGNLDIGLDYERTNYFGAFTWAFDHMRKEILYARKKETAAIEANKTIIASLSHDIKTPIASIRAYSEALEANLETDYEKREKYVTTILKKCDEVTALVNDLVLHSLSELEKLDINMKRIRIHEVIKQTVEELEFKKLYLDEPVPEALIEGDEKRIRQIIENLLNNARKYAPEKDVHVFADMSETKYSFHIKDEGNGIPPEDMPFIFDKFYRGKNVKDMPGSGLGLYIVSYLVKEMGGEVELHNSDRGLDVEVRFEICKNSTINGQFVTDLHGSE